MYSITKKKKKKVEEPEMYKVYTGHIVVNPTFCYRFI